MNATPTLNFPTSQAEINQLRIKAGCAYEEPDASIAHVRIRGSPGWATTRGDPTHPEPAAENPAAENP